MLGKATRICSKRLIVSALGSKMAMVISKFVKYY